MTTFRKFSRTAPHKVVLACDPGFDRLGIAVITGSVHEPRLVCSACIETDRALPHERRLGHIAQALEEYMERYAPTHVAIESLFFSKNTSTALKVAEARGVILSIAGRRGIFVSEHSPKEVKLAVTGYGNATKQEVARMTGRLFPIGKKKTHDDELDAIALGICALTTLPK